MVGYLKFLYMTEHNEDASKRAFANDSHPKLICFTEDKV